MAGKHKFYIFAHNVLVLDHECIAGTLQARAGRVKEAMQCARSPDRLET